MLTLHHAPKSRSSRIVWLLEELGADYAINYCDIRRRDGSGAVDPGNAHPDGKVPALIDDGALVTESSAIVLYLTDLFPEPGLGPKVGEAGRGAYLTWLAWSGGELEAAFVGKFTGAVETNPQAKAAYDAMVARLFAAVGTGPYLLGERFSAADILIGSALGWGREFVPPSEALDAYLARIIDRPAHARAAAKDEPTVA